ncbi:MAG: putative amidohydrolase/GNAT superfamily N-acetyltransferase [Bradymonadia bacterium]
MATKKKRKRDLEVDGRRLVVRPLEFTDFGAVVDLHTRCFASIPSWTEEQFEAQIATFSEGQIGVAIDGELVATSSSIVVDESDYSRNHTFHDVCGDGCLRNHDSEGDTLYGLDIAVSPDHRGKRLSRRIYSARKELAQHLNLRRIVFGGRMPRYHKHAKLTPAEYVAKVAGKEIRDPGLTAQMSNGFLIEHVLLKYLPSDVESGGHAVLMEWHNPYYRPVGRSRPSKVRVASVQYQMRSVASFEGFAKQVEFFVDTASEYRADFVVFPELLTNQLLALVPAARPALSARRLHEFTAAYEKLFGEMALRYAINIIAGTHLVVEGEKLYNVAYLFHRDGRVSRRYKTHITPAEERWWGVSPGDSIEAIDTDCGKVGIAICYDIEFPELGRLLRQQGAQIIFVPYNTDLRSGHIRVRSCAQARAIENHVYVVTSGAVGNLPMVEGADIHYAQSAILTPSDVHFTRDAIAEEATANVEMMLIHDLDVALLRRTERTGTVRPWVDRRLDIYSVTAIDKT